MTLPYENSTSGRSAMDDIRKTIQVFGCSKFAPMEDFVEGTVTIQFVYRDRAVQVTVSAKGYAAAWLRQTPHTPHHEAGAQSAARAIRSLKVEEPKG